MKTKNEIRDVISKADKVKFIKLGSGDCWASESIVNNYAAFGYHGIARSCDKRYPIEDICREILEQYYADRKHTKGILSATSNHARQVDAFLNPDENTIWITFFRQKMYWTVFDCSQECFDLNHKDPNQPSRKRELKANGWSCFSIDGKNEFNIDLLRGDLTKTKGYRGTICDISNVEYVKKVILNELTPEEVDAQNSYKSVIGHLKRAITGLNEQDFEIFIDLICSRAGLNRTGTIGGTRKDIDMQYESIVIDEYISIQVKSEINDALLRLLIENFDMSCSKFIIAHHGSKSYLKEDIVKNCEAVGIPEVSDCITVWNTDELAKHALNYGLYEWLEKRFL